MDECQPLVRVNALPPFVCWLIITAYLLLSPVHRFVVEHLRGTVEKVDEVPGRGLHSFPFQLNLSTSVHRVTNCTHESVLQLLKLSSNVNKCKPLVPGFSALIMPGDALYDEADHTEGKLSGRGVHSYTSRLNLSCLCAPRNPD